MDKFAELLGGVVFVGGLVLIVYFIARYTYLIKRMLIEKGLLDKRSESSITKLDVAYVVIGIGFGLLVAAGLSLLNLQERTLDFLVWGVVLISGAMGLVLAAKQKG